MAAPKIKTKQHRTAKPRLERVTRFKRGSSGDNLPPTLKKGGQFRGAATVWPLQR